MDQTHGSKYTDQAHGSNTRIKHTYQIHGSSTWIQHTDQIHGSNTRIKYTDQAHGSNTRIKYTDQAHGSNTRIKYTDQIHGLNTLHLIYWTIRATDLEETLHLSGLHLSSETNQSFFLSLLLLDHNHIRIHCIVFLGP